MDGLCLSSSLLNAFLSLSSYVILSSTLTSLSSAVFFYEESVQLVHATRQRL
jgi:hypothetical protein